METLSNGMLPCPGCGHVGRPTLAPGTPPHGHKALCASCGRFLKWLPKPKEEAVVMDAVNYLLVSGTLERNPSVRFREDGTCVCTRSLRIDEQGAQGTFRTFVPFEGYSKVAEVLGERRAN